MPTPPVQAEGDPPPHCMVAGQRWVDRMSLPVPALDDAEGERLPLSLPPVVDAHVHVFPDRLLSALYGWFDQHAWRIRYRLEARRIVDFLLSRGVAQLVLLHYAHRAGMARALNAFVAELCRGDDRLIGLATVLPGEDGARQLLEDAFAAGLRGVKLHCHVQAFSPDSEAMETVYDACERHGLPLVIHAGREPAIAQYPVDPYALCGAERTDRVLRDHPRLRICVPHLGADEFDAYERLLERHDNLWLDTTMTAGDFFPIAFPTRLLRARPDRVLYGTDFPIIPYAWDRELKKLCAFDLPEADLAALLGANARALWRAPDRPTSGTVSQSSP